MTRRTILGLFAHPDDECMGPGGTLAKYAALGHRVVFVTATDGGAGRLHDTRPDDPSDLRRRRRAETEAAADILGIEFGGFLDWEDGRLREMDALEVEERLAKVIRETMPDVVITFHGSGISYHPDHRVMTLATVGAFRGARERSWYRSDDLRALAPHRPRKLYGFTVAESRLRRVDWPRELYASSDDEVTTWIDTADTADVRWRAIQAHDTQKNGPPFRTFYEAGLFAEECFVRIFPSPRPGEPIETDLLQDLD